ncbi:unnamed protein product [Ostreobium quekettii]|uniref:Uncharacterized protein n=1 Tax=Ostreobium quekettii TaxID=121088 RepID=A0A8S1JBP0_9CHLO|nr:unnamed protein product [Ostreobium quekettii]
MAMAVPHYRCQPAGGAGHGRNPATVRVECTAADCGALLEVNVPQEQASQNPLVVRCGNCKKLLQVELFEKQSSPEDDCAHYGAPHMHTSSPQPPPTPPSAQSHVYDHGGTRNAIQVPQLTMPAPLSRSLFRTSCSPRSSDPQYSHPMASHYLSPSDPYYQPYPANFGPPQPPGARVYPGPDAMASRGHLQTHMGSRMSHSSAHSSRRWNMGPGHVEGHGGFNGLMASFGVPHARTAGGPFFREPSEMSLEDGSRQKKSENGAQRKPPPGSCVARTSNISWQHCVFVNQFTQLCVCRAHVILLQLSCERH